MYSTDTASPRDPQLFSAPRPCRVHARVRRLPLIPLLLAALGCGRTALEPYDQPVADAGAMDHPPDVPADRFDAPPDNPADSPADGPTCIPTTEICNGVDDDCNGAIDEDQPAIPCPNGGSRLCINGHYSDCPRRCEVCVPGSKRTCITSFCTFWGSQECATDGMSFGRCVEAQPPPECAEVASHMQRSKALELCCIEHNFCCVDEFDVNGNNDTTEMLGRCESITCE